MDVSIVPVFGLVGARYPSSSISIVPVFEVLSKDDTKLSVAEWAIPVSVLSVVAIGTPIGYFVFKVDIKHTYNTSSNELLKSTKIDKIDLHFEVVIPCKLFGDNSQFCRF
jgi:hypothetical protein